MNDHDPLCPYSEPEQDRDPNDYCGCDLIAHVRADERERCEQGPWVSEWAAQALEVEAEVRERLRAQVEALIDGHRFDSTTWDTGVPKCRHRDHRSGWSASCPQAWVAKHVLPLLGGESDE